MQCMILISKYDQYIYLNQNHCAKSFSTILSCKWNISNNHLKPKISPDSFLKNVDFRYMPVLIQTRKLITKTEVQPP